MVYDPRLLMAATGLEVKRMHDDEVIDTRFFTCSETFEQHRSYRSMGECVYVSVIDGKIYGVFRCKSD